MILVLHGDREGAGGLEGPAQDLAEALAEVHQGRDHGLYKYV